MVLIVTGFESIRKGFRMHLRYTIKRSDDLDFVGLKFFSEMEELNALLHRCFPLETAEIKSFPDRSLAAVDSAKGMNAYLRQISEIPQLNQFFGLHSFFGFDEKFAILYRTTTICTVCTFSQRRTPSLVPGRVVKDNEQVYLECLCEEHKGLRTLLCRDANIFMKMISSSLPLVQRSFFFGQAYDVKSVIHRISANPKLNVAMVDLHVFEKGVAHSETEIQEFLDNWRSKKSQCKTVVRICGKLDDDIEVINKTALMVEKFIDGNVILELSPNAMINICCLKSSSLLRQRIFPCVKYYMKKGEEKQCYYDMIATIGDIASFKDIQAGVHLIVEKPLPNFENLMSMMQKHKYMIRIVAITVSRSAFEVIEAMKAQVNSNLSREEQDDLNNIDILQVFGCFGSCFQGGIAMSDFVSFSCLPLFEFLLDALGYGKMFLRPYCGSGCVVPIIYGDAFEDGFIPLARLIDMNELSSCVSEIMKEENRQPFGFSISHATNVRKIIKQCIKSNAPDEFISILDGRPDDALKMLARMQIFIVRRDIDVAALDGEYLISPFEFSKAVTQLLPL